MLEAIATHIQAVTNIKLHDLQIRSISGGSINQAYALSDRYSQYFLKTNQASRVEMFMAEAIALTQIAQTQTIRVPQPICWGITDHVSYLVLEWLELSDRPNWQKLGQQLGALHHITNAQFGWERSNTIGSTRQINPWTDSWIEFWLEHRLLYQLRLAQKRGFTSPVSSDQLSQAVAKFFTKPIPALVHGDLWSGNVGFDQWGNPVIFDPALYFGDREVDIAMTELFGGFGAEFYASYNQAYPLDPGYGDRRPIYNLYHILNHFNLFGGSYGLTAQRMIKQIMMA